MKASVKLSLSSVRFSEVYSQGKIHFVHQKHILLNIGVRFWRLSCNRFLRKSLVHEIMFSVLSPVNKNTFSSKTISFSMKTQRIVLHLHIVFVPYSYYFQPSIRKR